MNLRAKVEAWLWRHGWAAPSTALCWIVAWGIYAGLLVPQQARLAAALATPPSPSLAVSQDRPHDPADGIRRVVADSPPADVLLATMLELATAEGIALPKADYAKTGADGLSSPLKVSQALRATYPQLRRYIESVLLAIPNASLDHLSAKRESVDQPQLEARLRWTLWLPAEAAGGFRTETRDAVPHATHH